MKKKLKTYELTVSDVEAGRPAVTFTALVDEPAIESYWAAFSKQEDPEKIFSFKVANEERRIIMGPAMIPDFPIYRCDPDGTEYNVVFSKSTIETIVEKWAKGGLFNNVNLMHDTKAQPEDVHLHAFFIIDKEIGFCSPSIFKDELPEGTWIQAYRVRNDAVWEQVKAGTLRGFSVEGFFNMGFGKQPQKSDSDLLVECFENAASYL